MKEAALALRVSRLTVYRWINSGALEAVRLGEGRPLRIPGAELERFTSLAGDGNVSENGASAAADGDCLARPLRAAHSHNEED